MTTSNREELELPEPQRWEVLRSDIRPTQTHAPSRVFTVVKYEDHVAAMREAQWEWAQITGRLVREARADALDEAYEAVNALIKKEES
jgi:hypothetical protein